MKFVITIEVNDVAEGDVTDLAESIWEEHAEPFDAAHGDFKLNIGMVHADGRTFPFDWEPPEYA